MRIHGAVRTSIIGTTAVVTALVLASCGTGDSETSGTGNLPRELSSTVDESSTPNVPATTGGAGAESGSEGAESTSEGAESTSEGPESASDGAESLSERTESESEGPQPPSEGPLGGESDTAGAVGETDTAGALTEWERERRSTPPPEPWTPIGETSPTAPMDTAFYFLESLAFAYETGVTEPLRSLSAAQCEACWALIEETEANAADGYYHDDLAFEMASRYGLGRTADGGTAIWVDSMFHASDILGVEGEVVDAAGELPFTGFLEMTFETGQWQVEYLELIEPGPDWSLE